MAADLGLDPEVILFVDDSERNAANALAAGMQTILYVDHNGLMQALKNRQIISLA